MLLLLTIVLTLQGVLFAWPATADEAPVMLTASKPLLTDVAAFPRIQGGGPAGDKINKTLERNERGLIKDRAECKQSTRNRPDDFSYTVSITITMKGPEFISFDQDKAYDCAGPHPEDQDLDLVFDLKTGSMVNWYKLLPATMVIQGKKTSHEETGSLSSRMLTDLYLAYHDKDDPDCNDELKNNADEFSEFQLYPDAAGNGIILSPLNLSHFDRSLCGVDVTIPLQKLRDLGVDKRLLDAIQSAHDHGWYDRPAAN